jgi:hypothetical protein
MLLLWKTFNSDITSWETNFIMQKGMTKGKLFTPREIIKQLILSGPLKTWYMPRLDQAIYMCNLYKRLNHENEHVPQ